MGAIRRGSPGAEDARGRLYTISAFTCCLSVKSWTQLARHTMVHHRTGRIGRASGATRTSTVIATVLSRLATLRPARPRAQASLPPRRRNAVHRAAALGPATSGLIASYERLGYG